MRFFLYPYRGVTLLAVWHSGVVIPSSARATGSCTLFYFVENQIGDANH
jgi:hypothetical protein